MNTCVRPSISCIQDSVSAIFTSADKSYITYPYPTCGIDKKTNNNMYCQYIGCIGGHITLSLRHWELTSLRRHIWCQLSMWRMSAYRNDATPTLKSNAGSKGLQDKNLSWLFGADRKIHPSGSLFGITRKCNWIENLIGESKPSQLSVKTIKMHALLWLFL